MVNLMFGSVWSGCVWQRMGNKTLLQNDELEDSSFNS